MTEASKAIDNLLASRLKKLKPESKDVVEVKRESEADMRAQQESRGTRLCIRTRNPSPT